MKQIHLLHADSLGGGPVVVSQHLRHFSQTWSVELWCGGRGLATRTASELGLPVRRFALDRSPVRALLEIPRLTLALRQARPELLVLHGQWAGAVGALAAGRAGVPMMVYVAHCPAYYHSTSLWRAVRNYFAEKWPCRTAHRIVALSEGSHYGYLYRGWMPEDRLVMIHNGVDVSLAPSPEEAASFRQKNLPPPDGVHSVFVGRMDDQKRVDWLLAAWGKVLARKTESAVPWHLWIVGGGSTSGNREKAIRRLVADSEELRGTVHFVGLQTTAWPWLAACDVVVMSSLYEGHALVPLEAMACGKPVVAFDTHGITDSVVDGETGFLVELANTDALAEAWRRLLENPGQRQLLGAAGRKRVVEKFSLARSLAEYEELYRGLLAERARNPSPGR